MVLAVNPVKLLRRPQARTIAPFSQVAVLVDMVSQGTMSSGNCTTRYDPLTTFDLGVTSNLKVTGYLPAVTSKEVTLKPSGCFIKLFVKVLVTAKEPSSILPPAGVYSVTVIVPTVMKSFGFVIEFTVKICYVFAA